MRLKFLPFLNSLRHVFEFDKSFLFDCVILLGRDVGVVPGVGEPVLVVVGESWRHHVDV